jgi:hypothetical protein
MQLLRATVGKSISVLDSMPPAQRSEGGFSMPRQAAGLSLPGGVHSAPFMNESFGVSARWLV